MAIVCPFFEPLLTHFRLLSFGILGNVGRCVDSFLNIFPCSSRNTFPKTSKQSRHEWKLSTKVSQNHYLSIFDSPGSKISHTVRETHFRKFIVGHEEIWKLCILWIVKQILNKSYHAAEAILYRFHLFFVQRIERYIVIILLRHCMKHNFFILFQFV